MTENRLSRSETDQWIGGVCGGLASYIKVDPTIVRGLFALLLFASGIGLPIYLLLWFIMPSENDAESQGREILESNFDDMGKTVSDKMNGLGKPGTVGTLLIIFGGYFLLHELGVIAWRGGAFWPALVIIAGAYLLVKRPE
jgi:phage shock protein PspC (stress-responsive transcriptional regulator)